LVIMNPPFTRHGAREGDRTEVHNPAFAAFGATEAEQNMLCRSRP
jgi:tRNA1(Val) A37 N6-methylase TrmN6